MRGLSKRHWLYALTFLVTFTGGDPHNSRETSTLTGSDVTMMNNVSTISTSTIPENVATDVNTTEHQIYLRCLCTREMPLQLYIPMTYLLIMVAVIGAISNINSIVVFIRCSGNISTSTLTIFIYQCIVDALVCSSTAITSALRGSIILQATALERVICYWLGTPYFLYMLALMSVQNMALLALNRFYAVCKPFQFHSFTGCKTGIGLAIITIAGVGAFGYSFRYLKLDGEGCVDQSVNLNMSDDVTYVIDLIAILLYLVIPTIAMIILYAKVMRQLVQRDSRLPTSVAIQRATRDITKGAITISGLFGLNVLLSIFLAIVFGDVIAIADSYKPVIELLDKASIAIISTVNPLIYATFLPAYRKKIQPSCNNGEHG